MKVKMLSTAAGPDGVLLRGSVYELDDKTAEFWVEHGYAQAVGNAAAVDPEPETDPEPDQMPETEQEPEIAKKSRIPRKRRQR